MPLIQTKGAASAQGFGEFNQSAAPVYIEDVFSTYLYTGTGATQTITNNIDLSTKGGLTWIKSRSAATDHKFTDTARGATKALISDTTGAQTTDSTGLTAFNANGFTIGADVTYNTNAATYASWTFRKQAKFFDVVTYTGNGTVGRTVAHNLGSVPGCMIIKRTDSISDWYVYHRSLGNTVDLALNTTAAQNTASTWNNTTPTSTEFTLSGSRANINGATFVAYLFAHDAGGFGLTGSDNVISCGSYTGNGSATGPTVTLNYEPQFLILKAAAGGTSGAQDWNMIDNMRGWTTSSNQQLNPNLSAAETAQNNVALTSTGFRLITAGSDFNGNGNTYIYIAIRRGPMKTPTSGTSVFSPQVYSSGSSPAFGGLSFPPDAAIQLYKPGAGAAEGPVFASKLQGAVKLQSSSTLAEASEPDFIFYQNGFRAGSANSNYAAEMFRRAPGFFDVVCYTGTGSNRTVTHNLGVAPELMIVKARIATGGGVNPSWAVYSQATGNTKALFLDLTNAAATSINYWNNTTPTSTVFSTGVADSTNASATTYVAYLFATVANVSKVGSYTGTGALQTVNCGFTSGARFVLIKRTDSTGDWWVYDSARGITSGNDPYLFLNSTAAEVTNTNYVDTDSTGFKVTAAAPAGLNANGGTFVFLAVA